MATESDEHLQEWLEACRQRRSDGRRRQRDIRPLGEVLQEYMSTSGLARRYEIKELLTAWVSAVGAQAAEHCRILGVKKGVLHVLVDSAACRQELASFRKREILAELVRHKGCEKIHDVEFTLGTLERQ